jgi:integrase
MALTDLAIRAAKLADKNYRIYDSLGLYMEIAAAGGKWWRLKYSFAGKEKRLSLGVYPKIGLKDARKARDDARRLLDEQIDPGMQRKAKKLVPCTDGDPESFESVAREWFAKFSPNWAPSHATRIIRRLERDVFPWLGSTRAAQVTPAMVLAILRRIEQRGAIETAHRARENCSQVFRYAVATQRAQRDPTVDLRGAIPPAKVRHFPAVIEPKEVGLLLRDLHGYEGSFIVKCAMRLAPLVFVRPGELRMAKWDDIDLANGLWRFIVSKTKTPHIVPLSRQAIAILAELKPLTGKGPYAFLCARTADRPMSDNAILAAMRRMGIERDVMTGHGFRAVARTILDEVLGVRPDLIEHQLAHAVRDPHGRAYNRTAHLPERAVMMQQWADYLDRLRMDAVGGGTISQGTFGS